MLHRLVICLFSLAAVAHSQSQGAQDAANMLKANMKPGQDPCANFYEYACGAVADQPPTNGQSGNFEKQDLNVLNEIGSVLGAVTVPATDGTPKSVQAAAKFYQTCLAASSSANDPKKLFNTISSWKVGGWPMVTPNWALPNLNVSGRDTRTERMIGHLLGNYQVQTFFNSVVMADFITPQNYSLITTQPMLPLGSRQFYIAPKFANFRSMYLTLIVNTTKQIRGLMGGGAVNVTDAQIQADAQAILNLEIGLARRMKPVEELRNIQANFAIMGYMDTLFRWPAISFQQYFVSLLEYHNTPYIQNTLSGLGKVFAFDPPGYIDQVHLYINNPANQRTVYNYMIWRYILQNSMYLPASSIRKQYEEFYKTLNEVEVLPPPRQSCAQMVLMNMPYVAGYVYATKYFPQSQTVINDIRNMIGGVQLAIGKSFTQTPWLDASSLNNVVSKLSAMQPNIAYPTWMLNPTQLDAYYNDPKITSLVTNVTLDLYQAALNVVFSFQNKFYGQLGQKTSKTNFMLSPATVNAWNDPVLNTINVPMGILAPPAYRVDFPKVINYAGIGYVLGHEMSHSFDDQGIQFDGTGHLNPLLTSQGSKMFAQKAQCLISQYSSYCYPNSQYQCVNGQNTQGENIADLNGLLNAYNAYQAWVAMNGAEAPLPGFESFSWDKVFFLQYANVWCSSYTNKYLLQSLLVDPHSPTDRRVNGVVRNLPQFQKAFSCPAGSAMVPTASQQCSMYGPTPVPQPAPPMPPTNPPPPARDMTGWAQSAQTMKSNLNTTVNPCNDFYQFACGGWQAQNKLSPNQQVIDVQHLMKQTMDLAVANALQSINASNPNTPKTLAAAKTYYSACMDWMQNSTKNNNGDLVTAIHQLNFGGWPAITPNWTQPSQYTGTWNTVGNLEFRWFIPTLLTTYVDTDWKNVSKNAIIIDQGTLGLGSQQYYTNGQYASHKAQYQRTMNYAIQALAGYSGVNISSAQMQSDMTSILNLETTLAGYMRSPADQQSNVAALYNVYKFQQIVSRWPYIDWETYLVSTLGIHISPKQLATVNFVFHNPTYIDNVHSLLRFTSNRTLANYLGWRYVWANSEFINFPSVMPGNLADLSQIMPTTPYQQRCIDHIKRYMPLAAGRIYATAGFDQKAQAKARTDVSFLTQRIVAGFSQMIQDLPWMDNPTKNLALAKASGVVQNIAYPDWIRNNQVMDQYHNGYWNSTLPYSLLKPGLSYFVMYDRLKINYLRTLFRRISIPGDRSRFFGSPADPRAMYDWSLNAVTVPFGVMQKPLYTYTNPESFNFGGLGTVIAHQLTHGFDSIGVNFVTNGTLHPWLSPQATTAFAAEKQCVANQYKNICYPGSGCVNGDQTLFENIAEIAGIRAAYYAYEKYRTFYGTEPAVPGLEEFSNEQLFFTSFAQQYCQNLSPQMLTDILVMGRNAPNKNRVNSVLQDFPQFAHAFKCPSSSPMAQQQCRVWN